MPLWLYALPNWLFGVLIISAWVTLGVGGHALCHRFVRKPFHDTEKEVAIALLAVVATINSLLLAFSAVSVWEAFVNAQKAVSAESDTIGELASDLAVFNTDASHQARDQLKDYIHAVIEHEWPAMRKGEDDLPTWDAFDNLFRAVGKLRPGTPSETVLMPEIWARTNELIKFRRSRLAASHGEVPGTLWVVVLIGTMLTVMPTFVLPRTRFNRGAIGVLSVSMGLVFFFVGAMDRPFLGEESIGTLAFESSLNSIARWDAADIASTVLERVTGRPH